MIPLFLGLTAVNMLCLAISTAIGYGVSSGLHWETYHQLFGLLTTILCCAVHCIVFTYFIATAKWIQHAVTVKRLDPDLVTPTRSFKAQALPAAFIAMAMVCLTAFVGAATFSYGFRPIYHHALALACLLTNLVVAAVEYQAIARNGALIDRILATINPATA